MCHHYPANSDILHIRVLCNYRCLPIYVDRSMHSASLQKRNPMHGKPRRLTPIRFATNLYISTSYWKIANLVILIVVPFNRASASRICPLAFIFQLANFYVSRLGLRQQSKYQKSSLPSQALYLYIRLQLKCQQALELLFLAISNLQSVQGVVVVPRIM